MAKYKVFNILINHDGTTERFEGAANAVEHAFNNGYSRIRTKDRTGDITKFYAFQTNAQAGTRCTTRVWAELPSYVADSFGCKEIV